MAKVRPALTVAQMEQKLGFRLESLPGPGQLAERWYSNLTPVCLSVHMRMEKEYDEHLKRKYETGYKVERGRVILPRPGETVVGTALATVLMVATAN
jgi:hypothetical protein